MKPARPLKPAKPVKLAVPPVVPPGQEKKAAAVPKIKTH